MDRVRDKVCPYCKTRINDIEDVVVCSKCNMLHHKSCWIENKGCTTFGCTGTIDKLKPNEELPLELEDSDFGIARCQNCGSIIPGDALLCDKCRALNRNEDKNNLYYIEVFKNIKTNSRFRSWNWNAYLLSYSWLFYRRMYKYGAIVYLLTVISVLIDIHSYLIAVLILHTLLGFEGDFLYYGVLHNDKTINNSNSMFKTNIRLAVFSVIIVAILMLTY